MFEAPRGEPHVAIGEWLDGLRLNHRHWVVFGVCAVAFLFDAFDFQNVAMVMPSLAHEWKLGAGMIGNILAATPFGMLVGTFLFGLLADRIGRRTGFQITIGVFALFSGLCAFAQTPAQLIALRFVAGIGIGGFLPVDSAVMTEFMPALRRGQMMALWAIFFSLGNLLAAWVGKWVIPAYGWRTMFLLGAAPAVMILAIRVLVPETPRFLLTHGRLEEARKSIAWISCGALCGPLEAALAQPLVPAARARFPIAELFSPAYRRRTAVAWLAWFTWSYSYFGLLLWLPTLLVAYRHLPPARVFTFIIGYTAAGIVGRLVASSMVDRIGRKPLIIGCGMAAAAMVLLFSMQETLAALALFGFAVAFFQDAGMGTILTYTPELFPTRARATGVGAASGVGRVAITLAPLVVALLVETSLTAVFLLFAASLLLGSIGVWLLGNETRGQTLERAAGEVPPIEPGYRRPVSGGAEAGPVRGSGGISRSR